MSDAIDSTGSAPVADSSLAGGDVSPAEPQENIEDLDAAEAAAEGEEGSEGANPEATIDAMKKAGDITAKEAKELKKKLKLKVDGREIEDEIDFNDEEGLKKRLQKAHGFDAKSREFATLKTQTEQLLKMLQEDPEGLLEKMGLNVDELAEKRLSRKVEEMKKSPQELEAEKMRKELEDLRTEKKKAEDARKQAELESMRNQQAQQIENDITSALDDAKSILPKKNPLVMQRVAQTMLMAMQRGYTGVTAKDVIPLVEKQWQQELNELFSVSSEEVIEKLVGQSNMDRYRKKRLANRPKGQTQTPKQVVKDTGKKVEKPVVEKPKTSMKDFFDPRKM